jgi:hypothetical protein
MQTVVKGMVRVAGTTDRIVRVERDQYSVVPIVEDVPVGAFANGPTLQVTPSGFDSTPMRETVRIAIPGAKTRWVGRLALA